MRQVGTLACHRCGAQDVSTLRVSQAGAICDRCRTAKRKPRKQPERAEQRAGVKLLRALGATVYTLGTTRRRGDHPGTMQSPGLPDCLAFIPKRRHPCDWIAFYESTDSDEVLLVWEVKAKGGKLRPEQAEFRDHCLRSKVWHVTGDCGALIAALIQGGYMKPENVPHYRVPQEGA